jgi:hypothetical protein
VCVSPVCRRALRLHKTRLDPRFIEVFPMTPQEFVDEMTPGFAAPFRRPGGAFTAASPLKAQLAPSYAGVTYPPAVSAPPISAALPLLTSAPINPSPDILDCLRIGDIPPDADNEELTRFFARAGVIPLRLHRAVMGETAYLEFANEGDADKALALRKESLRHRRLEFTPTTYEKVQRVLRQSPPRESSRRSTRSVRDRSRSRSPRSPVRSRSRERERKRAREVVLVRGLDFDRSTTSRGGYSDRSRSRTRSRSRSPVKARDRVDRADDPRISRSTSDERKRDSRFIDLPSSSTSSRTSRAVDSYRERARDDYSSSSRK